MDRNIAFDPQLAKSMDAKTEDTDGRLDTEKYPRVSGPVQFKPMLLFTVAKSPTETETTKWAPPPSQGFDACVPRHRALCRADSFSCKTAIAPHRNSLAGALDPVHTPCGQNGQ